MVFVWYVFDLFQSSITWKEMENGVRGLVSLWKVWGSLQVTVLLKKTNTSRFWWLVWRF